MTDSQIKNSRDVEYLKKKFGRYVLESDDVDWTKVHEDEQGRLVCDVCGKLKTFKISKRLQDMGIFSSPARRNGDCMIRTACDCITKREEEREAQEELRKKRERVEELRRRSNMGELYKNARFETFDTEHVGESVMSAFDKARKYAGAYSGCIKNNWGMYLFGPCGVGKTHIMACIANELMDKHLAKVYFTSLSELGRRYRDGGEAFMMRDIRDTDFLFIDDIGSERFVNNGQDTYMQQLVFNVLDERLRAQKPTVFSSNYSLNELEKMGLRVASIDRILQMSTRIVEIKGRSYRQISREINK